MPTAPITAIEGNAVRNGIRMAAQMVENGVLDAIKEGMARYQQPPSSEEA